MNKNRSKPAGEPLPPVLPTEDQADGRIDARGLIAESLYERLVIRGRSFAGQSAASVRVGGAIFEQCDFTEAVLPRLELGNVRFTACDVANGKWEEASIQRAEFLSSRLLGIDVSGARIHDTVFRDCSLALAGFGFSVFSAVRFERCKLTGADFQRADLRSVVFADCDLTDARLTGAKLEGTDLRGSTLANLSITVPDMRGMIVDAVQAVYLATFTGLMVR